jgi:DNA-binding transcriptional LysR family regulator
MYHLGIQRTLDGWAALQAVVRLGGSVTAAKRLNRSQSTISYAIARLQQQLGVKLFELKGRRAYPTEVGRLLLADAEPHLAGFRIRRELLRSSVGNAPAAVADPS